MTGGGELDAEVPLVVTQWRVLGREGTGGLDTG